MPHTSGVPVRIEAKLHLTNLRSMDDETDAGAWRGHARSGPARRAPPVRRGARGRRRRRAVQPGRRDVRLLVVLDGEVEISAPTEGDVLVTVHGDGRFLGELNLLTGQRPYLSAASRPGRVLAHPHPRVPPAHEPKPELADIDLPGADGAARGPPDGRRRPCGARSSARGIRRRRDGAARVRRPRSQLPHTWIDLEDDDDVDVLLASMGVRARRHARS